MTINIKSNIDGTSGAIQVNGVDAVPFNQAGLIKLTLRNVANTITSWFTTAATAARTWTMPDKDGTVAMTSDITGGTQAASFTSITDAGNLNFTGAACSIVSTNALPISVGGAERMRIDTAGAISFQSTGSDLNNVASVNDGQLAGLRNRIINGNFNVWQRGTSFFGGGSVYTADRWVAPGAAGQAVTRVADHPHQGTNGYCAQVVNTGGSQWIDHRIESANCLDLVGKTVTFSAYVKNISAAPLGVSLYISAANAVDNFTSKTEIGTSSSTTSTSWIRLSKTITVPAVGANGLECKIMTSTTSAATVRVAAAQLEIGSVATPFEHRPYGLELALCQRYYTRSPVFAGYSGFAITATQARISIGFGASMRIPPTALEQNGTAANYVIARNGGGTVASSAVPTFSSSGTDVAIIRLDFASGLTAGEGLQAAGVDGSYLGFSAEL